MSNQIFEIVTKATIAKGLKRSVNQYQFCVEHIDKILGCWICHHVYSAQIEEGKPVIKGSFELHIWYSYLSDSYLLKKEVKYDERMDLKTQHVFCNQDELKVNCKKEPKCVHATLNQKTIELEIEKEMALKIIGETTIMVENKQDSMTNQDLPIQVNTDFIT